MKVETKIILTGAAIFLSGTGLGYMLGVAKSKKQYQQESADAKDFYMNRLVEAGVMPSDFIPAHAMEIIEEDEDVSEDEEYLKQTKKYSTAIQDVPSKGQPIIKYNKPSLVALKAEIDAEDEGDEETDYDDDDSYEPESDEELDARAEEFARRQHENQSNGEPYVISYDEYMDGPENYNHQYLYYYAVDRVLCEDNDTVVEDEEELVGLDYEDVLDMQTTAWVRNDAILTLYENTRIEVSYNETVMGALETPKERENRHNARRRR